MRKVKIVADSSSDVLSLEYADFESAPLKIITAEKEFTDDALLDVDEMVSFLGSYKGKSQTSCPNTSDWLKAFGDADDVFCLTITSALSGSYNSACMAKKLYEENSDKRVFVIDTRSTGPETWLLIHKIEECIKNGIEFEQICKSITEYHKKTGLFFILKSVKNLANNGRISSLVAKIIGIANICIVGKASEEGTLETTQKCRGEARSLEAVVSELRKHGLKEGKVAIGHCQNENGASALKKMLEESFDKVKIEIHKLRGLCSFYAEKGGLIIGYEKL